VPQSEKEDAKLHCFCNQQASGRNFCRHVASSSFNEIRARLAGIRETSTEKRMGAEVLGFGFPFAFKLPKRDICGS